MVSSNGLEKDVSFSATIYILARPFVVPSMTIGSLVVMVIAVVVLDATSGAFLKEHRAFWKRNAKKKAALEDHERGLHAQQDFCGLRCGGRGL